MCACMRSVCKVCVCVCVHLHVYVCVCVCVNGTFIVSYLWSEICGPADCTFHRCCRGHSGWLCEGGRAGGASGSEWGGVSGSRSSSDWSEDDQSESGEHVSDDS